MGQGAVRCCKGRVGGLCEISPGVWDEGRGRTTKKGLKHQNDLIGSNSSSSDPGRWSKFH